MDNIKDENIILLKESRKGNKDALNTLIKKNIGIVKFIALKYQNRGLDLDDLIQEGFIGLSKAIQDFDISRNVKFTTYSIYRIRIQIYRAIQKQGKIIYLPSEVDTKVLKLKQSINDLTLQLGRTPNLDEIIYCTNFSKEEVLLLYNYCEPPISIYNVSNFTNEESGYVDETELVTTLSNEEISVEEQVELLEKKNLINQLLYDAGLSERAIYIIKLRYGFYGGKIYTHKEIAKMLNVRFQTVHSSEIRAINKLRKYPQIIELAHYLDNENKAIENIKQLTKNKYSN